MSHKPLLFQIIHKANFHLFPIPAETGRTFGAVKRFQSALLPIMYKLGVMSAVIVMTLFLAFKSVLIGTLILVLNLTFFAIKFGTYFKSDHHWSPPPVSHQPPSGWSPPTLNHGNGWPPHKDVHLHIHNAHGKPDYSIPYSTLGNGWDTQSNTIEQPTWNPTGYTYSGRALSDDGVAAFSNLQPMEKSSLGKSRVIAKRDDRQPTIVMAEKQQQQQHQQIVTPYNYINKPNQK